MCETFLILECKFKKKKHKIAIFFFFFFMKEGCFYKLMKTSPKSWAICEVFFNSTLQTGRIQENNFQCKIRIDNGQAPLRIIQFFVFQKISTPQIFQKMGTKNKSKNNPQNHNFFCSIFVEANLTSLLKINAPKYLEILFFVLIIVQILLKTTYF